jgi:hypothetical protein
MEGLFKEGFAKALSAVGRLSTPELRGAEHPESKIEVGALRRRRSIKT